MEGLQRSVTFSQSGGQIADAIIVANRLDTGWGVASGIVKKFAVVSETFFQHPLSFGGNGGIFAPALDAKLQAHLVDHAAGLVAVGGGGGAFAFFVPLAANGPATRGFDKD